VLEVVADVKTGKASQNIFSANLSTQNHEVSDKEFGDEFDIDKLVNIRLDHLSVESNDFHHQSVSCLSKEHSTEHDSIVNDTSVNHQSIKLKRNTTIGDKQLTDESRKQLPVNEIERNSQNGLKIYKRGQKRMCLDQITDEVQKKNIIRCREYRSKKNESLSAEEYELEVLELKNKNLREYEKALRERVNKLKETYFGLIHQRHIRFC